MEWIERLNSAINYIEENLTDLDVAMAVMDLKELHKQKKQLK